MGRRAARFADKPAKWIYDLAPARDDMEVELVDPRDYPMPFFDEQNAYVPSANGVAQRWQKRVSVFDGDIFVTAEYNQATSGILKNELDYAYPEWARKPGASEQLRLITVELQMAPTRNGGSIQGGDFFDALQGGRDVASLSYIGSNADLMLDELAWWTDALAAARAATPAF
ncbi:NADPH-dependent FMN reductase [Roseibium sp. M-1]